MGKKTNLKATLTNHQERQRRAQVQKAREAAKREVLNKPWRKRNPSATSKGKRPAPRRRSTIPLGASDTILLVGEGNFSFARALFASELASLEFLPPANVTATSYDSEEGCYAKYPDAPEIVRGLRERGVRVLFSVDARRLEACKELKRKKWQRVVWNFPHAGKGISDQDRNVLSNQLLILDFLKSVAPLLEPGAAPSATPASCKKRRRAGEGSRDGADPRSETDGDETDAASTPRTKTRGTVLITLRDAHPYTLWDLPRLAKKPPPPHAASVSPTIAHPRYVQLRSFAFRRKDWRGYEHRMTKGWVEGLGRGVDMERGGGEGEKTEDRMWEFYLE